MKRIKNHTGITATAFIIAAFLLTGCSQLSPVEFNVWEFFEVSAEKDMTGIVIDNEPNDETFQNQYGAMSFAFTPDGDEAFLSFVDHEESGDGNSDTDAYPVRVIRFRNGETEELPSPGLSRNGSTDQTGYFRGRYTKVIFDQSGLPCILYAEPEDPMDTANHAVPTVKYLEDGQWLLHSTPMTGADTAWETTSNTESLDIAIDSAGDLAFYQHRPGGQNDHPQLVRSYAGGSWSNYAVVASPTSDTAKAWDNSDRSLEGRIAFDADDKPYLFYITASVSGLGVSRLNEAGDGWEYIGREGSITVTPGGIERSQWGSGIDSDGILYMAYADSENGGRVTVTSFDGSEWSELGYPGFSTGKASWVNFGISPDGIPHIVYADASEGGRVVIQRYVNETWSSPVVATRLPGGATKIGMAFADDGRLFYGYYSSESEGVHIVETKN